MDTNKLICRKCGTFMNHHAEKINYSYSNLHVQGNGEQVEIVEEIHTCPECGDIQTRLEN